MDISRDQRRDKAEKQPVAYNDKKKGYIARRMSVSSKSFLPVVLPEESPFLFGFAYGLQPYCYCYYYYLLLLLFVCVSTQNICIKFNKA